jgi:hypothetical protein
MLVRKYEPICPALATPPPACCVNEKRCELRSRIERIQVRHQAHTAPLRPAMDTLERNPDGDLTYVEVIPQTGVRWSPSGMARSVS